tara:strand:- start:158 stop:502 length:345 start_codon:yes stop_codon:yes gene_type:complete
MVKVVLSLQVGLPNRYFRVWVPAPAAEGLKTPVETPFPEYVPPEGLPLDNVIEGEFEHVADIEPAVTVGRLVTFTVVVALSEQPALFVILYFIVWVPTPALVGLNEPTLTPGPE